MILKFEFRFAWHSSDIRSGWPI